MARTDPDPALVDAVRTRGRVVLGEAGHDEARPVTTREACDDAGRDAVGRGKEGGRGGGHALLVAIALGVALGFVSVLVWGERMQVVGWVGDMFLDVLEMLVVPLLLATLVVGVGRLGALGRVGRIGLVTTGYYLATTLLAVVTGIVLVAVVEPGVGVTLGGEPPDTSGVDTGFAAIAQSLVSDSLIGAMAELDVLPIIVFSIALGFAISRSSKADVLLDAFEGLNDAMLLLVRWAMWLAPVGVFALVASRFAESGSLLSSMRALGWYTATILAGLAIHGLVTIPVLSWIFARRNPARYAFAMATPLLTAFSTASSLATLPSTMEATERAGVSSRASGFVLPLGATVNMDGTALYEAVVAIFIAQTVGLDLSAGQLVVVALTATLAAIGAAGIPEAGLVTLVIVLRAVDLPLEGIGLLMAIDWLIDRFRTAINVWGDANGAAVVDRLTTQDETTAPPAE